MGKNEEKNRTKNAKKLPESIDPRTFLAYNRIMKKTTRKKWRALLRVLLPIVCVALLTFIFGNSLKTGEQSNKQSSTVVHAVQTVAGWVAPDSAIATATGAAYDHLHAWVRVAAHFLEFAALGAAMTWCCLSYTFRKRYLLFPFLLILIVPVVDETLQTFTHERAAELADIGVNTLGGICGALFALIVTGLILLGLRNTFRKEREEEKHTQIQPVKVLKEKEKLQKPAGYPRCGMYYKE